MRLTQSTGRLLVVLVLATLVVQFYLGWRGAEDAIAQPHTLIYVYDADPVLTADVMTVTGADCRTGPGSSMFDMEVHLHQLLLRSSFRTTDPNQAKFFYVPVYPNKFACAAAARTNTSYDLDIYSQAMSKAYEQVNQGEHWQRNQGRDHIFTVTHGYAYDALPNAVRKKCILLLSHGNRYLGFDELRHVIIPPALTAHARNAAQTRIKPWRERKYLASFKGVVRPYWRHSFGVRQLWQEMFADSQEILIENDRDNDYKNALDAVFCLCPPGFYAWTPRPVEALFYGCIPVIVGNEVVLPFDRIIDWNTISVRLTFDQAVDLVDHLMAITPEQRTMMQQAGVAARALFDFDYSYNTFRPKDFIASLLQSLQYIH